MSSLFKIGGYFFFVWDWMLFLHCLGLEVISSLFGIGGYFCIVWDWMLFLLCLGLEVISALFGIGCYFFFVWDWRLIGSYIRSWERLGDLPRVIEILCLFASGAQ